MKLNLRICIRWAWILLGTEWVLEHQNTMCQAQVYERVFNMNEANAQEVAKVVHAGSNPSSSLVQTNDGSFFGTTYYGGETNHGTIFKISPSGEFTTLVEFTGNAETNKGGLPFSGLTLGRDGNFYGTTSYGAINYTHQVSGHGTIFKMTQEGVLTTLVEFTMNGTSNRGSRPSGGLVQGSDGNFYGTTVEGGTLGLGTVFKMTPSGILTTLVEFTGNSGAFKGSKPYGTLNEGGNGTFLGTTFEGGTSGLGTVFRINPNSELETLVEFTGNNPGKKGSKPYAGLTQSSDGDFYGTTSQGGTGNSNTGFGTVYKLTSTGDFTTLIEFTGPAGDRPGHLIWGGISEDNSGWLYGTTHFGGSSGHGTVFRFTRDGIYEQLVDFSGDEIENRGRAPAASLILASDGNFYGTTRFGGNVRDFGTVFRLSPGGVMTTVVDFEGRGSSEFGRLPASELIQGEDGSFFGVSQNGGHGIVGTVYNITTSGHQTHLVEFGGSPMIETEHFGLISKGSNPWGGLVRGSDGNFYGVTERGGKFGPSGAASGFGVIFRISTSGDFAVIAPFTGDGATNRGSFPYAGLALGPDGALYGTTRFGGEGFVTNYPQTGNGTVFRVTESGTLTTLFEFSGNGASNKGKYPYGRLIADSDGNFYGTTQMGGAFDLGTVFRISSDGVFSTLVEFSGDGPNNKGSLPRSGLIFGSDGNLYGTTTKGGTLDMGTVYKMTTAGDLTTIVEFSGAGQINQGAEPYAALLLGRDGFFYGTTSKGGSVDSGTIYRMTGDGDLSTLYDFSPDSTDGVPYGSLIQAEDGDFYGTTYGGAVYRLVTTGKPTLSVFLPKIVSPSTVVLQSHANARGFRSGVQLEYGDDPNEPQNFVAVTSGIDGYQTRLLGTTIDGLAPGNTYYYRFRATNSEGETVTPVQAFTTLASPLVSAASADEILPTSARLRGTVDARNYNTSVRFEWGTDGNSFPNSIGADPVQVSGEGEAPVSAPLAGLTKGTTYFYRVVGTNEGGTTVSGTRSFRTLTDPTTTIGGSFALSTTSVRVEGSVDPQGSSTNVLFEYGTNGVDFPNSVSAAQGPQSGGGNRSVSAVLTNLQQGVTYHYRLRATSDGGVGVSSPATFSMNVLSGFNRVSPGAPPEAQGFLLVNLSPSGLLHGWRFVGETRWRASGVVAGGLTDGDRLVEFRPVPGHVRPPTELVSLSGGGAATVLERTYFETNTTGSGGLTVTLKPDSITTGEGRARWRLLGEDDTAWRDSGATLSALPAGDYVVECSPVPGRSTPRETAVTVSASQTTSRTLAYFEAGSFPGETATPLAFETVSQEPFAHVGQLRSSAGSGSGFVVKERVVATAAHVVWDEGSLSAASGLQWLHQRHAGAYEPRPLEPRGFYLLSGYADRRAAEATPGSFSPESRNLDVAALYFDTAAARGGYGGYLASDLDNNEFLLSDANKILAGYPLEGIAPASQGRMHATSPSNVPFTAVGPAANRTFLTTAIRSTAGASGGPLLVQFEGGAYYPAAIYLGGVEQSVVRALDSAALDLFNRAELSGIDGQPHVGGGVTHTSILPLPGEGGRGGLRVVLQPAAVLAKGARWRLKPESAYRNSGDQKGELAPGSYRLEFATVAGYQAPSLLQVQVRANQLTTLTFTYALPPVIGPEISVRGRGRDLPDGDASPSALDGTDFGVVAVEGATSIRTFAVFNTGNRALGLGTPAFSGDHAADFEVTTPPAPSVAPGGSTSFTVRFDPSAPGVRTATLSLPNNDANENPFNFALQGNHVADANSNGFSDVEETALNALLATFTVGQRVDLDLSFLRLGNGHTLALTGLPPGLVFNPATQRLTGTILGKPAPGHLLRKMDGGIELGSRAFDLRVFFPARLVVSTAPRRFAPTLVNRRSAAQFVRLSNSGELPLQRLAVRLGGTAPNDFLLPVRPPGTLNPGASATVPVVFRPLRKGTRLGSLILTSNDAPRSVPLSGFGK